MTRTLDDRTWFNFAEKLVSVGYELAGVAEVPITERESADVKVIACLLLCRTISNFRGAIVLAENKMVVEARTLIGCCFENLFFVAALRERGEKFVTEMFHHEVHSRRAMLKKLKQKATQAKTLNPKEIATNGPITDAYTFYSQLSADAAHPTTDSLSRYLIQGEENGEPIRGIDSHPILKKNELSDTLNLACHAALAYLLG